MMYQGQPSCICIHMLEGNESVSLVGNSDKLQYLMTFWPVFQRIPFLKLKELLALVLKIEWDKHKSSILTCMLDVVTR